MDEEWIDCTAFGSSYEQQIDRAHGRFRHRRTMMPPGGKVQQHADDSWRYGPAPELEKKDG